MLDRLVSILPASQRDKAKAYVAWLGAVATIVTLVVPEAPTWLAAVFAVLGAVGVYGAPNPGYTYEPEPQRVDPARLVFDGQGAVISNPDPLDAPNEDYDPKHD